VAPAADSGFLPIDLEPALAGVEPGAASVAASTRSSAQGAARLIARARQSSRHQQAARPRQGSEGLRELWQRWRGQQVETPNTTRAAAALRVREVELLRTLGPDDGVQALQPDLAQLLDGIEAWGPVVIEVANALGSVWLALTPAPLRCLRDQIVIHDRNRQVVLRGSACADAFLTTLPGGSALHLFDELGELVARVHLGQGAAAARLTAIHRQLLDRCSLIEDEDTSPLAHGNERLSRPGWCTIEHQVPAGRDLQLICRRIVDCLDDGLEMQLAMEGTHAIVACQHTAVHRGVAHGQPGEEACRLYFRVASAHRAAVCLGPDNQPFLRLHAQDGSVLRLQRSGPDGAARHWMNGLLRPGERG
jgi:hypothetical protein